MRLSEAMDEIARHLVIRGRVQGVFFRDWAVKTAGELALLGWVRNTSDGGVEAHVQGSRAAVDRFVELARTGPPAADVERIVREATRRQQLDGFKRL